MGRHRSRRRPHQGKRRIGRRRPDRFARRLYEPRRNAHGLLAGIAATARRTLVDAGSSPWSGVVGLARLARGRACPRRTVSYNLEQTTTAMSPERWQQVEELYHAAQQDRGVLDDADPELRREVELLLEWD